MSDKIFDSERWDINHLINDSKDVSALILLFLGRANDIEEIHLPYEEDLRQIAAFKAKAATYRIVAQELRLALQITEYKTTLMDASLTKGFLDD